MVTEGVFDCSFSRDPTRESASATEANVPVDHYPCLRRTHSAVYVGAPKVRIPLAVSALTQLRLLALQAADVVLRLAMTDMINAATFATRDCLQT
jgi:hypothetical protein